MAIPNKKVTIQEVAQLAKVSVATVSRALSKPQLVSEKTRQQVLNAVEVTGYTISEAARSLRRQQTDTIVVMVPNIGNSLFSNVVEGIEQVCAQNMINVLIADTQKASMSSQKARRYFNRNLVDGVIILDGLMSLDVINTSEQVVPIVFAGEWKPDTDLPVVKINDVLGVRLIIEHLHQLGHTSFGHITGPLHHLPGAIRYDSFKQVLTDLGHEVSQAWVVEGDFSIESGRRAANAWFVLDKQRRPSAIFCSSDMMALGFISELYRLGFKVPQDVSVVGYDDLLIAEHFIPALTTVHQPRRALGRIAAKTLLASLRQEKIEQVQVIDPWLIVRDSTTPYFSA